MGLLAQMSLAVIDDEPRIQPLDLYAPVFEGIEETANLIELRLALSEYRERHGLDHWRLFDLTAGRC